MVIEAIGQGPNPLHDPFAIGGNRDVLAGALQDRNREELRSVNADLFSLWKDFRQGMRQLITGD